ncbi:MAG: hypothetical protein QOI80_3185 [Solirubrobacteraceae bacterium]|jgi:hypothetical protein|nr:hypothetical protein [Solirubrobacteraceae bacterium]
MPRPVGVLVVLFGLLAAPAGAADILFTQTNAAAGNAVQVVGANAAGKMRVLGSFPTGGTGLGAEIESDGTLAWARKRLLVLDAGSNTISAFRAGHRTLVRTAHLDSGGERPVSLATAANGRVVVANGATLARFQVTRKGRLVRRGTRKLAQADPYAVALSPNGRLAAVTYAAAPEDRAVETFALGKHIRSGGVTGIEGDHASPVAFTGKRTLLVGRMSDVGAGIGHYRLGSDGALSPLGFTNSNNGVCWLEFRRSDQRGWATFPSGIRSFAVTDGIEVENDETHLLPGESNDLAESGDRVYVLNARAGATRIVAVDATTLVPLGESPELAPETTGVVDLPNNIGGFS